MQKIFTVYDSKAEAHLPPFFSPATGLALRAFETAANTPDHDFNKYPGDYTLFELGFFDEIKCDWAFHEAKINLGTALEFKQPAAISLVRSEAENRHANGAADLTKITASDVEQIRKNIPLNSEGQGS